MRERMAHIFKDKIFKFLNESFLLAEHSSCSKFLFIPKYQYSNFYQMEKITTETDIYQVICQT